MRRLTHLSPIYTHLKAEMATVRTGVPSSTKQGSEGIQKKSERRVCVCVCTRLREAVGFEFGSRFLVVEHQHQTVWSSKEVHSGRIIAYCL